MLFGHNTNLTLEGVLYHVQTEDRGESHAVLDTAVYCRGRVMHHRTSSYRDLLPLDEKRREALKLRLDEQHRTVLDEMRSGALQFRPPAAPVAGAATPKPGGAVSRIDAGASVPASYASDPASDLPMQELKLEFRNPKTWLKCNQATLLIAVHDHAGKPASARVKLHVEGAAGPAEATANTGPQGDALLEFAMPRSAGGDLTFVIEASNGSARGQLRFQLKTKPRAPAAS